MDELGGVHVVVAVSRRHAEADCHRERLRLENEWLLRDHLADALRVLQRSGRLRFRQNDRKLLAAVASGQLVDANVSFDAMGHFAAENVVAGKMAVLIVDRLEVIDVEHHERWRPLEPLGPHHLAVQKLHQITLVVNFGQRLDDRELVNDHMIARLDVTAGKEAEDAIADAEIVAVVEQGDS